MIRQVERYVRHVNSHCVPIEDYVARQVRKTANKNAITLHVHPHSAPPTRRDFYEIRFFGQFSEDLPSKKNQV